MHALILAIAALLVAPATPKPLPGKPSVGKKKGTKTKKTKGKKKVGKKTKKKSSKNKKAKAVPQVLVKSEGRKASSVAPLTLPMQTTAPGKAPSSQLELIGLPKLEFSFEGQTANTLEFHVNGGLSLSTWDHHRGLYLWDQSTLHLMVPRAWLNGRDLELSCEGAILEHGALDLNVYTRKTDTSERVGSQSISQRPAPLRFVVTTGMLTHDFDTLQLVLQRPPDESALWGVAGCTVKRLD